LSEVLLVDYSFARPDPAAIKAAGYVGVMRYLSNTPGKNLSAAERDALHAAGLSIGLVWETTASRAGQGLLAGRADAQAACAQAKALGYPINCPLFFAVDYDAAPSAVAPYFVGIKAVATYPVGVYGSYRIVEASSVPYHWQASAWSGGKVSSRAHLYQRLRPTVAHPVAGADENLLITPLPLWTPTATSTTPKGPEMPISPAEIDAISKQVVNDMLLAKLGHSDINVAQALQAVTGLHNTDVAAIAAAVLAGLPAGGAGVTVEQLAKAVNDDAARRLQS